MKLEFRKLKADEIECRIGQIKENGLSLLLYKDARCDMNVLDETVGALNWKREHTRDNKNCIVSIYDEDKKEWISKEDTGTESNTEAEKGLPVIASSVPVSTGELVGNYIQHRSYGLKLATQI